MFVCLFEKSSFTRTELIANEAKQSFSSTFETGLKLLDDRVFFPLARVKY